MPVISIITPSFNRGYIIDETAQSIFAQTSELWEWIVVDDGSTDDSWDKLLEYDQAHRNVHVFKRDREPKGACTCRNIGVEKASGDFLFFLDTDDLIGKNAIADRIAIIEESTDSGIPYFPSITFDKNPNHGFLWDDSDNPVSWLTSLFTMTPPCQGTAPLWRKSDFVKIGGWREDLKVWQDIDLHIRAYKQGFRFEPVKEAQPDIMVRLSPDSISHVGFHSAAKVHSRWLVAESVLTTYTKDELTSEEMKAFQTMVLGVFFNAASLRDLDLTRQILQHEKAREFLTPDQLGWMKRAQMHYSLRLYKVPMLQKSLMKARDTAFPFKLNRRLGTQTWKQ